MASCKHCESSIDSNVEFCKYCGIGVENNKTIVVVNESYIFFYFLGGFLIPILGIVGYLYLRKTKHRQAKALGVGVLLYFMFFMAFPIAYLLTSNWFI